MKTIYSSNTKHIHQFDSMREMQDHLASEEHATKMLGDGKVHEHVLAPQADTSICEHDKIRSRTTGKLHEIKFGPQGGGNVPANPFASLAQAGYLHSHPEILGKSKLAEFDAATKGKKLPKRIKK